MAFPVPLLKCLHPESKVDQRQPIERLIGEYGKRSIFVCHLLLGFLCSPRTTPLLLDHIPLPRTYRTGVVFCVWFYSWRLLSRPVDRSPGTTDVTTGQAAGPHVACYWLFLRQGKVRITGTK